MLEKEYMTGKKTEVVESQQFVKPESITFPTVTPVSPTNNENCIDGTFDRSSYPSKGKMVSAPATTGGVHGTMSLVTPTNKESTKGKEPTPLECPTPTMTPQHSSEVRHMEVVESEKVVKP